MKLSFRNLLRHGLLLSLFATTSCASSTTPPSLALAPIVPGGSTSFLNHVEQVNQKILLSEGKAFARIHEKSKPVFVLLHGLSDSPGTVADLASFFEQDSSSVLAPILSGHGVKPEDLAEVDLAMWRSDVDTALGAALEISGGRPIVLVGFSTGAALAVDALQRHGTSQFARVILVAPLLGFRRNILIKMASFLGLFKSYFGGGQDSSVGYEKIHINGILQTRTLVSEIDDYWRLNKIRIPIFTASSELDAVVSQSALDEFIRVQNVPESRIVKFPKSLGVRHQRVPRSISESARESSAEFREKLRNFVSN